ncbi:uncharacterized protein LOC117790429 [Drosophila innubila]|uniref:uncharacterized protein LOC117790429 n=1 Tax=Drosophila innubila TaxID=198719 RepID=UPI00148BD473|nr:uncharacterized protein LOC117790429 [Drosophila innubila]
MQSIIIFAVLLGLLSLEAKPLSITNDNQGNNITMTPLSVDLRKDRSTTMPPKLSMQSEEYDALKKTHLQKETNIEHNQTIPVLLGNEFPTIGNHTKSTKDMNDTEVLPTAIGTRLSARLLQVLTRKG